MILGLKKVQAWSRDFCNNWTSDIDNIWALGLALTAFSYTCLRAALVPVFHDEAVTYLYHAIKPLGDILTNAGGFRPNNHLFNTILIK